MTGDSAAEHQACLCGETEAIKRLFAEYGRLLDLRDAQGWAALFAPDGQWIGGEQYGVIEGRGDLAAFVTREFSDAPPCVHMFGNFAITVDDSGERASSWSRWMLLELGADGLRAALAGSYSDRLVRLPEGWRFARRDVALDLPAIPAAATSS